MCCINARISRRFSLRKDRTNIPATMAIIWIKMAANGLETFPKLFWKLF